MANTKELIISIGGKLNGSLKTATGSAKSELTGLQKASGLLKGAIIGALGAVSIAGIVSKGKECIAIAEAGEKTTAQLNAVLESTHGAAGMTMDSATKLAASLSSVTTYSKGTIKSAESMLLTFTGIKSNVFPGATEAALNMATALKTDATSAAQMLGKALNDPATGLTKLTRNGVVFTAEQKKQIIAMTKAGDVAGAQKLMLKELDTEYGNSARAAANTTEGRKLQIQNSITSIKAGIGQKLLPIIAKVTETVASHLPQISAFVDKVMTHLQPLLTFIKDKLVPAVVSHMPQIETVLKVLCGVIATVFGVVKKVIMFIEQHKLIFQTIAIAILAVVAAVLAAKGAMAALHGALTVATAATRAFNVVMAMNPISLVILGIVALVAAFVVLWNKSAAFRNFWIGLWDGIKAAAAAVANWFGSAWDTAISTIKSVWSGIGTFFSDLWNGIKSTFDKVFGGIFNTISTIASKIKGLFTSGGGTITVTGSSSGRDGKKMATGGIIKHRPGGIHAIIGEGKDDEAVVPLKKGGFGAGNVTFAPVQNFYGDVNKSDVEAANAASFEQFKRWMKQYDADKKRRALA